MTEFIFTTFKLYLFIFGYTGSSLRFTGFSLRCQSLVTKHRLQGVRASVAVAHGLGYCMACEIFLDQGWNLCPLYWQVDS